MSLKTPFLGPPERSETPLLSEDGANVLTERLMPTQNVFYDVRNLRAENAIRNPQFPGWGQVRQLSVTRESSDCSVGSTPRMTSTRTRKRRIELTDARGEVVDHLLGEWPATAICGNDITGSVFYVAGQLAAAAGILMPLCALMSSLTLYLFRRIYSEAVMALPLNGGLYNILLNTIKSKALSAMVACLTLVSYLATAVVSSVTAASYLKAAEVFGDIDIIAWAIGIIVFFACLLMIGIKESS